MILGAPDRKNDRPIGMLSPGAELLAGPRYPPGNFRVLPGIGLIEKQQRPHFALGVHRSPDFRKVILGGLSRRRLTRRLCGSGGQWCNTGGQLRNTGGRLGRSDRAGRKHHPNGDKDAEPMHMSHIILMVIVYRVRRLRQAAHPLATGEWDMGKSLLQSREIRLRGLNFQPTQVGLVQ